ncbi:MAG: DUF4198 domain-containing protein [Verrucomicrobiota bacterium]|nr:DUF4198 domain-containing protein [Verrucomicrobiota bacterium]
MPDRFEIALKQSVTLNLTSGMAFPELETGPKRERVAAALGRVAGHTFDMSDISAGPKSLIFKTEPAESGVAAFWIKLPPRAIELKTDEVKEYLDEVSAPAALQKQWSEMKEPKRWRESYTKHPKTFVRVGDSTSDQSWKEPVGMFLEIVPEGDPTALRAGEDFSVRVLKDGAPFADFALNAVSAGDKRGETRKTDGAGRVTFQLSKAGPWLFRGTDIRKSTLPDADWESDFVTLTVEAKPRLTDKPQN